MERGAGAQSESLQIIPDGHNIVTDLWVERYGDILYRFALVRVQCPATAEDLVQETFVAALKSQNSFRRRSSHQTWLIGILKHKIMDHFRSQGRTVSLEETAVSCSKAGGNSAQPEPGKIPIKEWDATPERIVEDRAFREAFQSCLDRLPERAKQLFLMREADGVDSGELCKVFGMSATNLWVTLHRVRSQLKVCLEKNWFR